jgi:aconitate hydratase
MAPACSRATPAAWPEASPGSRPRWPPARRWWPSISQVAGLQKELDQIGFNLVGFGCTTCIGNSGPLPAPVSKAINDKGLIAAAVLSGNRNFEGRISPDVQANYLASPPLVVAYALAGTVANRPDDRADRPGPRRQGRLLKDIWPSNQEIQEFIHKHVTRDLFEQKYAEVFKGDENWQAVQGADRRDLCLGRRLDLRPEPALFPSAWARSRRRHRHQSDARILGLFGDKITTDHISPAGSIKAASPAGQVPDRPRRRRRRLQPVRHAPRQS